MKVKRVESYNVTLTYEEAVTLGIILESQTAQTMKALGIDDKDQTAMVELFNRLPAVIDG